ncbi:MAG: ATPase [Bacteroidetes bacterium]|nr:MAG: ATPase [Bacteroidota bacterium]
MKDYKNYYTIKGAPEEVYLALTNPLTMQLWTGEEAIMDTKINSEFSLFGGDINGKNLEFEEGKKIVQQWYFDQEEASVVSFLLHKKKKYTSLELRHSNIPDDEFEDVVNWWNSMFMDRLIEFYDE